MIDRRSFMGLGALAVAAAACRPAVAANTCCAAKKGKVNFKFGMAGFSCHRLTLDETLQLMKKLDLHYLCIKDFHLPIKSTQAEIDAFKQKCADFGVTGYGVGPIYMATNDECKRAFDYAKAIGVKTVVAVPNEQKGKKRVKTDKRDAKKIAKCLAYHTYSPVHIPTEKDDQVKEFIRMRDDIKANLKRTKQQIISFCLRHGLVYTQTRTTWTQAHLKWLRDQKLPGLYQETLDEYILHLTQLMEKVERLDKRIEDLSNRETYKEAVDHMTCFIGIKRPTALAVIAEVGDFRRFATACQFSSYLGLTPARIPAATARSG